MDEEEGIFVLPPEMSEPVELEESDERDVQLPETWGEELTEEDYQERYSHIEITEDPEDGGE